MSKIILHTDGGARGNPGPSAAGVFIQTENGSKELGVYLGKKTNNEAEYLALIVGMKAVIDMLSADLVEKFVALECFLDSELVVKQLNGDYKVKNERMQEFYKEVKELEDGFSEVTYRHILRGKNKEADALVNVVLDFVKNAK